MIIECPQCQNRLKTEATSIPPEGMQILCDQCSLTFTLRPHQVDGDQEETGTHSDALHQPAGDQGPSEPDPSPSGIPDHIFLQKDEIPAWLVDAYEQGEREAAAVPIEDTEQNLLSQDFRNEDVGSEQDIPILLDEEINEEEFTAINGFPTSSYPTAADIPVSAPRLSRGSRIGIGIGVLLTILLALLFLAGKNFRQDALNTLKNVGKKVESIVPFKEVEKGKIQFSNLAHDFVERGKNAPPVFVIEGKVTNHYPRACNSVQVMGILFNEKGKRAAEETVFCGNALKKREIQSLPRNKIKERLQNTYGSGLSNFNIQPGGSIPFMLVFFDPPEKVSEFSIEIADYRLGEQSPTKVSNE